MSDPIIIVGASLAGLRAAEALRRNGVRDPITVIGDEPHLPYDRPPLSKHVLLGKSAHDSTALPLADSLEIDWRLGTAATGLDLDSGRVILETGENLPYASLIIATGARPRILPAAPPGPGVHYLRTRDDALRLLQDLSQSRRTAVIGAGFIGLEVASSIAALGVPVTVLEALTVPLELALGPEMGQRLLEWHLQKGLDIRTGVAVSGLIRARNGKGTDRPEGVLLQDGTVVEADTVVVGIGVSPATGWLADSGVALRNGVLCDHSLRVLRDGTPLSNVVAAGDVARWAHPDYPEGIRIEHWTNAAESGEAAARTLLMGADAQPYAPVPYFWSDQHGVKIQFVGHTLPGDDNRTIDGAFADDRVVVAFGRGGRLVGALGIRRPVQIMALQRLIQDGASFPPEL